MMKLKLTALPHTIRGIYGAAKNELPERMRYLHPDAAASYLALEAGPHRLHVSDMWRSAEASMQARHEKRGVKPPGHSGHNYGLCIDVAVERVLEQEHWRKAQLDDFMKEHGWFCHRKDHERGDEWWHFSFFGKQSDKYLAASENTGSTAAGLEQKILDTYGSSFTLSGVDAQGALQTLKLYAGAIDGQLGPLTAQAVRAFQRTWELPTTGELDASTQRLLAFMTCSRELVPAAA